MNTQVSVWRFTREPDGMGGWVQDWAEVGSTRARLSHPSAAERVLADQSSARLSHVAYLAAGSDVQRGDRLHQGARVFNVLAVFEPSAPGTYLRADCERIQVAHE
ncbi:head-tail adaptor protein [Streptomyces sp. N35]|uniref:head-tail adaptor protein n=1 Tax=Streptomyces sp. N35 TaxID=2795730 RepID=UPI0035ABD065